MYNFLLILKTFITVFAKVDWIHRSTILVLNLIFLINHFRRKRKRKIIKLQIFFFQWLKCSFTFTSTSSLNFLTRFVSRGASRTRRKFFNSTHNPNLVLFSRLNKNGVSGDFSFVLEEAEIYIRLINVNDLSDVNFFCHLWSGRRVKNESYDLKVIVD